MFTVSKAKYLYAVLTVLVFCCVFLNQNQTIAAVNSTLSATPSFTDISPDDPDCSYINYLANRKIINGYPDGSFHPEQGLTRAQAAVIVVRAMGLTTETALPSPYNDVNIDSWAAPSITAASQAGYIKGFPDGTFHPDERLSRVQGIVLILRLSKQSLQEAQLPALIDINISHWAAKQVANGIDSGMIELGEGGTKVFPDESFTRANLARALGILLTEDSGLNQSNLEAKIEIIKGKVSIIKSGSQEELSLLSESQVSRGDTIKTGSNSEAELIYPDGSSILLKELTQIKIKEFQGRRYIKANGQEGIAVDWLNVQLDKGTIFGALATTHKEEEQTSNTNDNSRLIASLGSWPNIFLTAQSNQSQPWYQASRTKKVKVKVDMPWGVACIKGTFVRISVAENGQCSLSCLTGNAELSSINANGQVGKPVEIIQAQQTGIGSFGLDPTNPVALSDQAKQEFDLEKEWIQQTAENMDENKELSRSLPGENIISPVSTRQTINNALNSIGVSHDSVNGTGHSGSGGSSDSDSDSGTGGDDNTNQIEKVNPINDYTNQGNNYNLPVNVPVILTGQITTNLGVSWTPSVADTDIPGTYVFIGTVAGYPGTVSLTLTVIGEPIIKMIEDISVSVAEGESCILPGTVKALMSDGTQNEVPISWQNPSPDTSKAQTLTINGNVNNYSRTIKAIIIVNKKTEQPVLSSQKAILGFTVSEQSEGAVINSQTHSVTLKVNSDTDITRLGPDISISDKARINPSSHNIVNFTNPVEYTVTAEDGSTQIWTATIIAEKHSSSELLSLNIISGTHLIAFSPKFNKNYGDYSAEVSYSIDYVSIIAATIDSTAKISINGSPAVAGSFSEDLFLKVGENQVNIVVSALDGTNTTYSLNIKRAQDPGTTVPGVIIITPIDDTCITVGEQRNIQTITTPADCSLAVSSSKTDIAVVSATSGMLTIRALSAGCSTISITATKSNYQMAVITFELTVLDKSIIICSMEPKTVNVGSVLDLTVVSNPTDAVISASCNDTSKALVTVSGHNLSISGVAAGSAVITIRATKASYSEAVQTLTITVNPGIISISPLGAQTIGAGSTVDLTVVSNPADAIISASCNNTSKAVVNVSGHNLTITGAAAGSAVITIRATKANYTEAVQTLNVTVNPSIISISPLPAQTVGAGSTVDITVISIPSNAGIAASSSDTSIAAVSVSDHNLTITGKASGSTEITVIASKPNHDQATTSFTVTVTAAPIPGAEFSKIFAGWGHNFALKNDGTIWAWGFNDHGQLGDNSTTDENTPVQIPGLNGINTIATGNNHNLALKNDGTVWAWGYNGYGQLGDNSSADKHAPLQVPGLSSMIAIAAGENHSLALKGDGTVWTWGNNTYGQLGINDNTERHVPVQVPGLAGVTAIAVGHNHSLALKADGTLWIWGLNDHGQLGRDNTNNASAPVQVQGLSGVTFISAGGHHSLVLTGDGLVWSWGSNESGQLGDNTKKDKYLPTQVQTLDQVVAVAAGENHNIALKSDGTVWTWGLNDHGQLGNKTTVDKRSPVQIDGLTGIVSISAGGNHNLALDSNHSVWSWGINSYGQLGNHGNSESHVPIQVLFD